MSANDVTAACAALFEGIENGEEEKSDINSTDSTEETPLLFAVSKNQQEIVRILLNLKTDTSVTNNDGLTPMQIAIRNNFRTIALLLLKHATLLEICSCSQSEIQNEIFTIYMNMPDVDVNLRNASDETPLHFAALYGNESQVKALLKFGADVNAKSFSGETPLHWAVVKGRVRVVELLLEYGDVNCFTSYGTTPLHAASNMENYNVSDCKNSTFQVSLSITKMLLNKGADVHARDSEGKTALHYAVAIKDCRPDIIRSLLHHGADVNAISRDETTPIFYAENEEIVSWLLNRGANINHESKKYHTLLYKAVVLSNNQKMVEVLLENKADLSVKIQNSKNIDIKDSYEVWDPEILEALLHQTVDFIPVIRTLVQTGYDHNNMIPIIAKRNGSGEITFSKECLELVNGKQNLQRKFKMCEEEIFRMKNFKIPYLDLSLFAVLVMPIDKMSNYVNTKEILQLWKSKKVEEYFPLYAEMLKRQIGKARNRKLMINSSSNAVKNLVFTNHRIRMPDLVVKIIVSLLNRMDLINLARVCDEGIRN